MGLCYSQACLFGIKLDADDLKVVLEPAIFEEQARYDPRTGKKVSIEKVQVKYENAVYRYDGCEGNDLYELGENLVEKYNKAEKYTMDFVVSCDVIYLGYKVISDEERDSWSNIDLLDGTVDIRDLMALHNAFMISVGTQYHPQLHFISDVS